MELTRPKVLALVLAGGEGGRLDVLTAERAKPAVPYAGVYRLIDFPLSNCRNSGVSDVWVFQQYRPSALTEHLANGRPWDLDRSYGGLRLLHPHLGLSESGWYQGNADAIYRNKGDITAFRADVLLVLSADHVYKLDYADVVARHVARGADVTAVTTRVDREDASRFGVVDVDGEGRITSFAYKPDEPAGDVVTAEVFAYSAVKLMEMLDELAREGEESLADFGEELLPRLVASGNAYEYRLDGYWRDVGTVESYWKGHMELLAREPGIDLDDPAWPILTWATQRPPARVLDSARIGESLVSPGCLVGGRVERSVLAPGVVVEEDALVRNSIVFGDTVIRGRATVERAVIDSDVVISEGAAVGGADGDLTLVGRRAEIRSEENVEPGARIEPGARVGRGGESG